MEIRKVNKCHKHKLERFFEDMDIQGKSFLYPYPFTTEEVERVINYKGKDVYYVIENNAIIIAYGFLRGWDDHWKNICLGVMVASSERGKGYGKLMCDILHTIARHRKIVRIRLHVKLDNIIAFNLYKSLGYTFASKRKNGDWIGYKILNK